MTAGGSANGETDGDAFGHARAQRLFGRVAGIGAALAVAWPFLPLLHRHGLAGAIVYVVGSVLVVGVPTSYALEAGVVHSAISRLRLAVYAVAGAVAGAVVAVVLFPAPGLVAIAVAIGLYLAVGAAAVGPRLRGPIAVIAALNPFVLAAVAFALP